VEKVFPEGNLKIWNKKNEFLCEENSRNSTNAVIEKYFCNKDNLKIVWINLFYSKEAKRFEFWNDEFKLHIS